MDLKRLETARLFHRFGFGPRPGEFAQALSDGIAKTKNRVLSQPLIDSGEVPAPPVTDLGPRPAPNSAGVVPFSQSLRFENQQMLLWWLDQMVKSEKQLQEKMVWFWHGHWATSIGKVNYSLPMYNQNKTFRKYALGNFSDFAQTMFSDGALQIWLDGGDNNVKAPNENLSREMMELFLLGVNRYTETDVKELARAFTGYQVTRSTGAVNYNEKRRDVKPVTVLGKTAALLPEQAIAHLVSQTDCGKFIAERIWFRFISSTTSLPEGHTTISAFNNREISQLVFTLVNSLEIADPNYSIVKQPVEWFIGVCRALSLTPSKLDSYPKLYGYFSKMSQIPFEPPNVGGWPTDESWLSSASAQFRVAFATWLVGQADLSSLTAIAPAQRSAYLLDLLGVVEWTPRTMFALRDVRDSEVKLLILAICSPEYVVSV